MIPMFMLAPYAEVSEQHIPVLPGVRRRNRLLDELRVAGMGGWRPATIARKRAAIAVYHRLPITRPRRRAGSCTRRQQRQKTAHEIAFSGYYIVDAKSSICFAAAAARRTLRSHGGQKSGGLALA
jgi:hypothetical protein